VTVSGAMLRSAATAGCLCLAACSDLNDHEVRSALQPNPIYAALAIDAMERLRAAFNSGHCDVIYAAASLAFRELETRVDWVRTCTQLHANLGSWDGFTLLSTDAWQSDVFHVDGRAAFAKGSGRMRVGWSLENQGTRLFSLRVWGVGHPVVVPEVVVPRRRR
jgi:hypothetical protein